MKNILLSLGIILLASCGNNITPETQIPPPPPKADSAEKNMNNVDNGISNTISSNVRLEEKIKTQNQVILEQKMSIKNAIAKAEKMQEQILANEAITQIQTLDLIKELENADARNLFLEKENDELEKIRKEQELILKKLKDEFNFAQTKVIAKEKEADDLRNQNSFLAKNLQEKNIDVEKLQQELSKVKADAAKYKVYRNWVIGLAVALVLYIILTFVIKFYSPFKI